MARNKVGEILSILMDSPFWYLLKVRERLCMVKFTEYLFWTH